MSDNESIQAEQDPMDGSSEKTAVPPMADLRLAFDLLRKHAAESQEKSFVSRQCGKKWLANLQRDDSRLYSKAAAAVKKAIKQKACLA